MVVPHRQKLLVKLLLVPLGLVYNFWIRSIRFSYGEKAGRGKIHSLNQPATIILWHNRLFIAGEWHRRFRKSRSCYGLISGSRDGAWLETFYGWAGIRAIRGSQNRRGAVATREMIRVLRAGHDIGVTPDGSRGPIYEAKQGALFVAKASRSPVVLLSFTYTKAIRLKSWDRFAIPFPFSTVHVQTRILSYDELFQDRDLEQTTSLVQQNLLDLTDDTV
jgi:lysophospholipid acyltransferase (LPLAT)-like uncharacterized protein